MRSPTKGYRLVPICEQAFEIAAGQMIVLVSGPNIRREVTDAVVLSKSVDGMILVIRAGHTAREMVRNGIAQFGAVSAPLLGAVLNGVDMSGGSYNYQYYYYYYGEDGERRKKFSKKKKSTNRYGDKV